MTKAFTVDIVRCTKVTMLSEDVIIRSGNSPDRKQVCFATFWRQIVSLWIKESQISLSASSKRRDPRGQCCQVHPHSEQESYTQGKVVTFKRTEQFWRILVSTSPSKVSNFMLFISYQHDCLLNFWRASENVKTRRDFRRPPRSRWDMRFSRL